MAEIVKDIRPICGSPRKPWPKPEYVCELPKGHKGMHEAVSVKLMSGTPVRWRIQEARRG